MSNDIDEKIKLDLANKFRTIRLEKNLTQDDVAKKGGIDTNYYAKVERGESSPSVVIFRRILIGLDIKSSDVISF